MDIMCMHTHTSMKTGLEVILPILFIKSFSLISLAKLLCHSLNLNSAAFAECSKWKEEAEAAVADVCSQLLLSLCWLF